MKKQAIRLFVTGLFLLATAAASFSEEMAGKKEMSPEQKDMMAKMEMYSTPNENHALLASLIGSWKATVEHKMSPESPAEKSEGISKNIMIFGGMFLEQSYQGDMMGKPFEGKGIMGYDSMGTGIMTSTGIYDPAKKAFTEEGHSSCPMTMSRRWFRGMTTLVDSDHYTYEMFMKDDKGIEFRAMRIQYSRIK